MDKPQIKYQPAPVPTDKSKHTVVIINWENETSRSTLITDCSYATYVGNDLLRIDLAREYRSIGSRWIHVRDALEWHILSLTKAQIDVLIQNETKFYHLPSILNK